MGHRNDSVTIDFTVQGMSCSACASRIEKAIGRMPGVREAAVSFALRTAWVQYEPEQVQPASIAERVDGLGFKALFSQSAKEGLAKERNWLRLRLIVSALLSLPLIASMVHHFPVLSKLAVWLPGWVSLPWLQLLLATMIQFFIGLPFYIGAYHALRSKSANMDVLVAVGTSAAYLYSHYAVFRQGLFSAGHSSVPLYFETSAVVITAVLLGKYIETSVSLNAQRESIGYESLHSRMTTIERESGVTQIRTEFVKVGDIAIVEAGETVPVDGVMIGGESAIDESLLTGESMPVAKREGDAVWAGTRNESGRIRVRTQAAGHDTMLSRIQELVKGAQRSKSELQSNVDATAGWFVPIMLLFSAATFVLWALLLDPGNWSKAYVSAIAVMLAACPCALGLAAPISLVIASGNLAKQGIITKEAGALERLARINTIVIDKTGTLTEGKPNMTALLPIHLGRSSLLRLSASAEAGIAHPLAGAIWREAERAGIAIPAAKSQALLAGGVEALIEGQMFALGNRKLADEQRWELADEAAAFARDREKLGETVLYAALNRTCVGVLAFKDQNKPYARQAVGLLRRLGIEVMAASGDHAAATNAAAKSAGIGIVHASMLPETKLALIERLKRSGRRVAMAGDGWNDAPALAAADVGFAMGDGTPAALNAGHITLLYSRLDAIPGAIRTSRLTIRNIRQNLTFAFIYNAIIIPFAAIGLLEPWMAGAAMALSSVSVVGNALRLRGQLRAISGVQRRKQEMRPAW